MIVSISKKPYFYWWERAYYKYRLTHRSVVLINGIYYNVDGFDGKLAKVHIDGAINKIGIRKAKRYRYDALVRRKTLCNHIDLDRYKYKFDMKADNCQFCYLYTLCSRFWDTKERRVKHYLHDIALVSKFLADNRDLAYETK